MSSESRDIRLQSQDAPQDQQDPRNPNDCPGDTVVEQQRRRLRGAMVVGETPALPKDELFPNLWSSTAYDSMKYSHLRKAADGLLDRGIEGMASVAGLPLKAVVALAERSGLPVRELLQDPAQLQEVVRAVAKIPGNIDALSGHQPSFSGALMPRGFEEVHMSQKEAFLREHREEFQKIGEDVREKLANRFQAVGSLVDSVGGAASGMKNLYNSESVREGLTQAHDFIKENPGKATLGLAGVVGGGVALKSMMDRPPANAQHQSFAKAMEMFPELQQEDPQKIQMLWSSAAHVAPNMSQNPMLLGTWIKGLAKGFDGTHLSTEDLKRLQDLEIGHAGRPPDRQSGMDTAGNALGMGSNLAKIMDSMSKGQGRQ